MVDISSSPPPVVQWGPRGDEGCTPTTCSAFMVDRSNELNGLNELYDAKHESTTEDILRCCQTSIKRQERVAVVKD
eukprot:scaffold1286_cov84-Amphora_coffeaeformis.AAC.1